ncbi:MAG: hypothetical protein QOE92_1943, partial [Chloroflexota bacterium]|nr:hypothetical protein [Chloroflexota bacterium]
MIAPLCLVMLLGSVSTGNYVVD